MAQSFDIAPSAGARADAAFAHWAAGAGVIVHEPVTRTRVSAMVDELVGAGRIASAVDAYEILAAVDRLANAGMWLVAHMTYARRVRLDGEPLLATSSRCPRATWAAR
jgi:hypothetical protein